MDHLSPQARPAATTVILRDRVGLPPEILFMERSGNMAFAAGALVFPGGAIDAQDRDHAASLATDLPIDEAAARVGAIRETVEESGLAIGFRTQPDRFTTAALRNALHEGMSFAELLSDAGLELDLDALIPFARWKPPANEKLARVFDTRFYLARAVAGSHEPSVDATENMRLFWASALEILERYGRAEVRVIFPTLRNLERLARFHTFDEAAADAGRFPITTIMPWIEERGGRPCLCIPENLGYPVTCEFLDTSMRG
ncbi:MAG TPA: NUDIX hydrolase [Sphingobium sp.]